MVTVYLYGAGLFLIVVMYVVSWAWKWYSSGIPDTAELIKFLSEYTSTTLVAAVTFLSVFQVDRNRDGRPDIAEKKAGEGNDAGRISAGPPR